MDSHKYIDKLLEGARVDYAPPKNASEPDDLLKKSRAVSIPDIYALQLQNIAVTRRGVLLNKSGPLRISFPTSDRNSWKPGPKKRTLYYLRYLSAQLPKRAIRERSFICTDKSSCEYFHWLCDAIPRIYLVTKHYPEAHLFIPETCIQNNYALRSLAALDISRISIIKKTTRFKRLIVPGHAAPTGHFHPSLMQDLRSLYHRAYAPRDLVPSAERIYISRAKADKRRVANENEVDTALSERGFKKLHLEDYPFEAQVRILANAKIVVGNHGAGLANILFMRPGGTLIEFKKAGDNSQNHFWRLASTMRIRYFYQSCSAADPTNSSRNADIVVDIRLLRDVLEAALQ